MDGGAAADIDAAGDGTFRPVEVVLDFCCSMTDGSDIDVVVVDELLALENSS